MLQPEFKAGRRVRAHRDCRLDSLFWGKTGTIIGLFRQGFPEWWVKLDQEVRNRDKWIFDEIYLEIIALTPEEELKWQMEEQEQQKQIEDQQRRQKYADKYL